MRRYPTSTPTLYVPSIVASGAGFVLGTGGNTDGRYVKREKEITGYGRVSLGNGGGASPGVGTYTITVPYAPDPAYYAPSALGATRHPLGTWTTRRDTTGLIMGGALRLSAAGSSAVVMNISAGGTVGAANLGDGAAAAVEDEFFIEFRYWTI